MKKISIFITATLILAACQKNDTPALLADTITAQIEQETATKTYMDANNNIRWSSGDQVVAFMKTSYGHKYQLISSFAGKTYADFELASSSNGGYLSAGTEWDHNVVYYPYSDVVEAEKTDSHYSLSIVLPTEQTYAEESFGNGAMAMVAVSEDNNITFKNILGGMKLQLKGTQKVASITLQGKNSEKLSGAATVTAYTDETKPAITMSDDASTSVTLNCGAVQLNESTATEFIIALPPILFTQGFTITVTDSDSQTYTVETDKANTVLRSSLLVMPSVKLDPAGSEPDNGDDETVPVSKVTVNKTSLTLTTKFSYTLTAKVTPVDATDQSVAWSSDNTSAVTVDQSGVITTLSSGIANITAEAGGVTGTCKITVIAPTAIATADYKDEYGINHGKGIVIGGTVWAPVNCGYKAATADSKGFPFGKLYQWGRKYGQGYSTDYDESEPEIIEGTISSNGHKDTYSNTFFTSSESPFDWLSPQNDQLWNSGTEEEPVKTEYDPCPTGWRVPTYIELNELRQNYSPLYMSGLYECGGRYFSGSYTYIEDCPRVFMPASGERDSSTGKRDYRRNNGYYWSSSSKVTFAYFLFLRDFGSYVDILSGNRANGNSVRCVQVTD